MYIKISLTDSILKKVLSGWFELFSNFAMYYSFDDVVNMRHFVFEVFDHVEESIELTVEWLNEKFDFTNLSVRKSENIRELIVEQKIGPPCMLIKNDKIIPRKDGKTVKENILEYFG